MVPDRARTGMSVPRAGLLALAAKETLEERVSRRARSFSFGQDTSFNIDELNPCSFKYLSATAPLNTQVP